MGNSQVVILRSVAVINRIEFWRAIVFGPRALVSLGRIERRRRGDNRDARLGERFFQRLKRRIYIMRPAIGRGVPDGGVIFASAGHVGDWRVVIGREASVIVGWGHVLRSHTPPIMLK